MDPLVPFARNDRCWCGADAKYKACHGAVRPRSVPGEPIERDDGAATIWLSPNTSVARSALVDGPQAGAWFSMPTGRPQTRPVSVSPAVQALLAAAVPATQLPLSASTYTTMSGDPPTASATATLWPKRSAGSASRSCTR
ncbi:SEC-C domain-containing protein [Phytohabitans suffuscus]|uniref:SEC-C domain-containing protein n=1 Tax=Phytohabitans suffuscus TaxID=624315 RepID=UPI0015675F44